ncbi:MAG: hypothetical protein IKF78_14250 [Atopobiaceae bacterium]|nr:hypothetical protein [Atopobiaceae bacterium]
MAKMIAEEQVQEEDTLANDIKKIVGGVGTIVLLVVPIIVIRKLVKKIENSDPYKSVENRLM